MLDLFKDDVLPRDPGPEDLLPYVRLNLKRSRLRRKFLKSPHRYRDRVRRSVYKEYFRKIFAKTLVQPLFDLQTRESFARKVFKVVPMSPEEVCSGQV